MGNENDQSPDGLQNGAPARELGGGVPGPPPPDAAPAERPAGPPPLLGKFLSAEHVELLRDVRATWAALWLPWKILLGVLAFTIVGLTLWVSLFRGGVRESTGVWSRLLDSGLITGLAGVVFAYLKRRLQQPPAAERASSPNPPPAAADDGPHFLDLSRGQWLGLLVAAFIPTLLASLVSSFLVGDQIHVWLTGPLLALIGMAIAVLSWEVGKTHPERHPTIGMAVGSSALLLYAATCVNTRWVLLFYTVGAVLPALHLFTVARRGVPPIRWNAPLLAGFCVIAAALAFGVFALPRGGGDESEKLVGAWAKDDKVLIFTSGGTVRVEGGYSEWVAKYRYDGRKLTIYNDSWDKVVYDLELTPEIELLFGRGAGGAFGEFSVLTGRWRKDGPAGDGRRPRGGDPKPGSRDPGHADPPRLDSPLAPKLVGMWSGVGGDNTGSSVLFTKTGKAEFTRYDAAAKRVTETVRGTYSFKKDGLLQLDEAGALRDDGGNAIDIEFLSDDEILLVNHRRYGGGFNHLAGRFKRDK